MGHCERAHWASVAINRIERSDTLDCFGYRLAMTRNSTHKNIHCHVERSETSCHCERAQRASAAINEHGIPTRLIATRLTPLAMTDGGILNRILIVIASVR